MTAPNLPKVKPSAAPSDRRRRARRAWSSRVRVGRYGPRMLLRGTFVGLALLVLVLLLAGCGNAELPAAWQNPAPPATPSPTASPDPSPTPAPTTTRATPSPAPESPARTTTGAPGNESDTGNEGDSGNAADGGTQVPADAPLWPAGDAATAQRMQQQADRGGDPWLLDPEEVTLSYVGAELGYRDPSLTQLAPGTFAASDGRSPARATVMLEQTVRTGAGGIWLVTTVDRN